MMKKRLRTACFPTTVFLIINVFPPPLDKKNRATSPPESRTHLFSTERRHDRTHSMYVHEADKEGIDELRERK